MFIKRLLKKKLTNSVLGIGFQLTGLNHLRMGLNIIAKNKKTNDMIKRILKRRSKKP